MSSQEAPSPVRHSLAYDVVTFIALAATTFALGGALAHVYELLNKIDLPRDEYFIVQKAYRGWALLGWVLGVELFSIIVLAAMSRHERHILTPLGVALACLIASQVVFWTFTFPTNVATENWTRAPEIWEGLRAQWEYSHAVGAVFQLGVMSALVVAVLRRARRAERALTNFRSDRIR